MEAKEQKVQGKYVPVKPIDPNEVSIQEYLYDTNSLLTRIENLLTMLVQMIGDKKSEKDARGVRVIGGRNDS